MGLFAHASAQLCVYLSLCCRCGCGMPCACCWWRRVCLPLWLRMCLCLCLWCISTSFVAVRMLVISIRHVSPVVSPTRSHQGNPKACLMRKCAAGQQGAVGPGPVVSVGGSGPKSGSVPAVGRILGDEAVLRASEPLRRDSSPAAAAWARVVLHRCPLMRLCQPVPPTPRPRISPLISLVSIKWSPC